ncbi:MAG: nitroreductase family protein, partial [Candidatus Binatia bacterium]
KNCRRSLRERSMNFLNVFEAIHSLRTIRRFRLDPVRDEDIRTILEAATKAPSSHNRQPWRFLVIRDEGLKREVARLYHKSWWAKRRDEGVHSAGDIRSDDRVTLSAMYLAEHIQEAPVIILVCLTSPRAYSSIYPAVQNLLLAARGLGLGTTPATLHPIVKDEIQALLEMPEEVEVATCIPLGYPRGRFGPTKRRPVEEVTYYDKWDNPPPW